MSWWSIRYTDSPRSAVEERIKALTLAIENFCPDVKAALAWADTYVALGDPHPPFEMYIIEAETHEQAIEKAAIAMHKIWGSMAGTAIKYDVAPEPVPRSEEKTI